MKKLIPLAILLLPLLAFTASLGGGSNTIGQLDLWKATTTPNIGVTQKTYGKNLIFSGLTTGLLQVDSDGLVTGGGTGGSSWATTSTDYWIGAKDHNIGGFNILNVGKIGIATSTPSGAIEINDINGYGDMRSGIIFTDGSNDSNRNFNFYNAGESIVFSIGDTIAELMQLSFSRNGIDRKSVV